MADKYHPFDFISKAKSIHGDRFDYSNVNYVKNTIPILIRCIKHDHTYTQTPMKHTQKGSNGGCKYCLKDIISQAQSKTEAQFILECQILNPDYDYSQVEYKGDSVKVKIICPIHGIFEQTPSNHLRGQRCSICKSSKGELKILNWLDVNNIDYIKEKRFPNCKHKYTLPFDFYIQSLNLCIEYDGEQHFVPMRIKGKSNEMKHNLSVVQLRDSIKTQYCIDNEITLLRIPYTDFDNIEKILEENIKKA